MTLSDTYTILGGNVTMFGLRIDTPTFLTNPPHPPFLQPLPPRFLFIPRSVLGEVLSLPQQQQ